MTWSRIVYGSLIQCINVEARHRSDKPSPYVSASVFDFSGLLLVHNFLSKAPQPLTKITTLVPMEGQWRIHYFILHIRDLLPQDYKAFCITWKSKACYWGVVCISLVLLFYFLIFTTKLYPVLSFNDSYHRCLELLCLTGFSFPCWLGTMVLDSHCVNTRHAKTSCGCLHWTRQSKVTECQMFRNFRYRAGRPITFGALWTMQRFQF